MSRTGTWDVDLAGPQTKRADHRLLDHGRPEPQFIHPRIVDEDGSRAGESTSMH